MEIAHGTSVNHQTRARKNRQRVHVYTYTFRIDNIIICIRVHFIRIIIYYIIYLCIYYKTRTFGKPNRLTSFRSSRLSPTNNSIIK